MLSTPLIDSLVPSNCRALTHSIVPSHVHTHTWLFTGVPTLVTLPDHAAIHDETHEPFVDNTYPLVPAVVGSVNVQLVANDADAFIPV